MQLMSQLGLHVWPSSLMRNDVVILLDADLERKAPFLFFLLLLLLHFDSCRTKRRWILHNIKENFERKKELGTRSWAFSNIRPTNKMGERKKKSNPIPTELRIVKPRKESSPATLQCVPWPYISGSSTK